MSSGKLVGEKKMKRDRGRGGGREGGSGGVESKSGKVKEEGRNEVEERVGECGLRLENE